MNGAELVTKFKLYTGFTTDMSDSEILSLINNKYRKLLTGDLWEFLRKEATGVVDGTNSISMESDFDETMPNYSDDDSVIEPMKRVVYINSTPYAIVPMGARNTTYGTFCWVNQSTGKIEFKDSVTGSSFSYDYKSSPDDITTSTISVLPNGYEMIIVFDALLDQETIDKSEKARSNAQDNFNQYKDLSSSLRRRNLRASIAQ